MDVLIVWWLNTVISYDDGFRLIPSIDKYVYYTSVTVCNGDSSIIWIHMVVTMVILIVITMVILMLIIMVFTMVITMLIILVMIVMGIWNNSDLMGI